MLAQVKKLMQQNGYKIFTRPLELNIVGIRNNTDNPNQFNDELHVFFRSYSMARYAWNDEELQWNHYRFVICTDPASYANYEVADRCWDGLLVQGQYINGFKRAQSVAGKDGEVLLQKPRFPIHVFYERFEGIIHGEDFQNLKYFKPLPSGRFINIYYDICLQPSIDREGQKWIDRFGGGCQVFERREDFQLFMQLCAWHQHVYGNNFTYTLIDFKDAALSANARLTTTLPPCRSEQSEPDRQAAH